MRVRDYFHAIIGKFAIWRGVDSIDTTQKLQNFVADKAAYVAQTTLYGYIRTRAGLQHFQLFSDDKFVEALRPARNRIFVACAGDLAVFCAARVAWADQTKNVQPIALAQTMFIKALDKLADDPLPEVEITRLREEGCARIHLVNWSEMAEGEAAFQRSIRSVIKEAPIIDALKVLDEEIVINSVRFKWQEVRADLVHRLDASAIIPDLNHPQ